MDNVTFRCGQCELDPRNRRFTRAGLEVTVEPKVFSVLVQLLRRAGELVTRDELLDAVWGHRFVTPSTLNRVITLARRAFADDADGQSSIQTVYGSGYRYVGPIETERARQGHLLASFAPPASARLPSRLHELIGRTGEIASLGDLLGTGRALTIVGPGGIGKTQCAIALAHEQAASFPDGIWFFDLAATTNALDWLNAFAIALGLIPSTTGGLLDQIADALRGRAALLLLDNCDKIAVGIGSLVFDLMLATENLKVLATSQQVLNFVGERVFRMPPLRLPEQDEGGAPVRPHELPTVPAVALLLARIRETQPEFQLTAANTPAIVAICRRLDGMPLALELAAARFALLSPEQVLDRLDHRFRFLVSGQSGRDERHRNLVTLLEWSYSLLSPEEQRFLAWLAVFVQGWTVDAAVDFATAFGAGAELVVDLLTGLAEKSLVWVDHSASPPRYRLLESVRDFALGKLKELGGEQRARDAHLAWAMRLAQMAHRDMLAGRMRERIALLAAEQGNIEGAAEYAASRETMREEALMIPGLLMLFFKARGIPSVATRLCERALSRSDLPSTRGLGMALMCLGVSDFLTRRADWESALTRALRVSKEAGDAWTEGYAAGILALALSNCGRVPEIESHLKLLERIAERLDDDILRGLAGWARGWRFLACGENARAVGELRPVRLLGGDYHQRHIIDVYTGLSLYRLGQFSAAAELWYEGLRNAIAVGNMRGMAGSLEGCAYLAWRGGRAAEASSFLSAAEQIRTRTNCPLFSFWLDHNVEARAGLESTLGTRKFADALSAGTRLRVEDVVNAAGAMLRELSSGSAFFERGASLQPGGHRIVGPT